MNPNKKIKITLMTKMVKETELEIEANLRREFQSLLYLEETASFAFQQLGLSSPAVTI